MNFSSQAMLLQNAQWPYSFPYKPYDFGLHPAFLQSAYRPLPTAHYEGTAEQPEQSHTVTPKVDKFSIDAILKKDSNDEKDNVEKSETVNQRDSPKSATEEMELACRRYQRFYEMGHPYISQHQQTGAEKSYLHKHLQTFKQFSDRSRSGEKVEKKPSQLQDTWSKQSKGKRVRTIFTPEQLERMEAEFERQQYMVGTERYYLASALNLTEAQVKVWFQNRRIKWRKQHLEQQQAKLKSLNMYKDVESESDSENDDTIGQDNIAGLHSHVTSVGDPFQSPKEERCTQ